MKHEKVNVSELDAQHGTLLPAREELLLDTFFFIGNASAVAVGTNLGDVAVINFVFL